MNAKPKLSPPPAKSVDDLTEHAMLLLEGRGYDVRGKTTAEIHKIIKRPPTKAKPNSNTD
jgi:hypothetical protein